MINCRSLTWLNYLRHCGSPLGPSFRAFQLVAAGTYRWLVGRTRMKMEYQLAVAGGNCFTASQEGTWPGSRVLSTNGYVPGFSWLRHCSLRGWPWLSFQLQSLLWNPKVELTVSGVGILSLTAWPMRCLVTWYWGCLKALSRVILFH